MSSTSRHQPSAISRQSSAVPKLNADSRTLIAESRMLNARRAFRLPSPVRRKLTADSRPLRASLSPRAFTLIEILVVIVIIMILVGIVLGTAKYAQTKGARSRTQAEIAAIETALESFKTDNGYYPNTGTTRSDIQSNSAVLYDALASGPKRYFSFKPPQLRPVPVGGHIYTNIIDAFGSPLNYFQTNDSSLVTNVATFDLWSRGPDGSNDTVDDISNWKQN